MLLFPHHSWPAVIDGMTKQLSSQGQLNDIGMVMKEVWKSISAQVQQNLYGAKMALQQLRALNG